MRLAAADAAAAGRADGHGREEFPGTAVADARQFTADLIEARIDVIRKLNFGDRAQAVDAHADGRGDDAALGDGRVDDPMFAVLALQSLGGPKHAAEIADVLAHEHHRRIPLEHDVHGGVQSLNHVHSGHELKSPQKASRRTGCSLSALRLLHAGRFLYAYRFPTASGLAASANVRASL